MVLVDLVSREGETLEEYRARQALDADQNWTCVPPESKCAIKAHMGTVRKKVHVSTGCTWQERVVDSPLVSSCR